LSDYIAKLEAGRFVNVTDSLKFWVENAHQYEILAPIAEDLISAPASQAYAERVFCLW
jgi:hypothetical protein